MNTTRLPLTLIAATALPLLAACAIGPDYHRPDAPLPQAYKEDQGWQHAQPQDAAPRGAWWTVFGDATLDALEQQAATASLTLAQAEAQYRQAQAQLQIARAGLVPTLGADSSASRSHGAANAQTGAAGRTVNQFSAGLNASWELDLWGRVRRTVEAQRANAEASAADLESARLSLQAQLAQTYFQLRVTDEQRRLYDDTVAANQRALQLTQNQYAVGVAAKADVVQAQTQLATAQAQALDVQSQRAQLEHALAVLVGKTPAEFSLAPQPLPDNAVPPAAPADMPSTLLQRRPDIAAAERRVAAANAQIGVAETAYFPTLTLSASGGFQNSSTADWFTLPNRVWSLGPQLALTLFDGGARRAQTAQAQAAYDGTVAAYRQTVLTAFQEVEDNLAQLRVLEQESQVQTQAVALAQESLRLATNQYKAGTVSYLNVVSAQNAALAAQRSALSVLNTRLAASVGLIKALGGTWDADTTASAPPSEATRSGPSP